MKKEEKILMDVYKAVYSELGVDIDELIEDGTTKKEGWFMEYEMPNERQEQILKDILSKSKLNKRQKRTVEINYWLGCSPKSV